MRRLIPHISVYQPNGWSNAILPIDVLHKLVNEMNGVIDIINHMEDESVERAKEYTDSQIDIVEASIASTNNNLDQINQNLQASIRSLTQSITVLDSEVDTFAERINATDARVTENYNAFTAAMNQVYRDLNSTATQLRNYADLKDLVLKEQLEEEIEELRHVINDILEVETIDGLTGLKRTVRQILSTYIIDKVKRRGGNRFAMTWGQMKIDNVKNGWLPKINNNVKNAWLIIAPTWANFRKTTSEIVQQQTTDLLFNTWGSFVNNTRLYILSLISAINAYVTTSPTEGTIQYLFTYVDVFDYNSYIAYKTGTILPSIINNKDLNDEAISMAHLTYKALLKSIFVTGYNNLLSLPKLYNYSDTNYLFDNTSIGQLVIYLIGNNINDTSLLY